MKRRIRLTALSIFILSAGYTSAQSVRKLMEIPDRTIQLKWEQDVHGGTELNYYNEDLCDYFMMAQNFITSGSEVLTRQPIGFAQCASRKNRL